MKKPSLKLTKRQRLEISEIHKIIKKPFNSTLVPRPQKYAPPQKKKKKEISHVFLISGGNILQDKAHKNFSF